MHTNASGLLINLTRVQSKSPNSLELESIRNALESMGIYKPQETVGNH